MTHTALPWFIVSHLFGERHIALIINCFYGAASQKQLKVNSFSKIK